MNLRSKNPVFQSNFGPFFYKKWEYREYKGKIGKLLPHRTSSQSQDHEFCKKTKLEKLVHVITSIIQSKNYFLCICKLLYLL